MAAQDIEINVVTTGVSGLRDVSLALRSLVLATQGNVKAVGFLDARQRSLNEALGVGTKGMGEHAKTISQTARNQHVLARAARDTTLDLKRLRNEMALGRGGAGMPALVRDLRSSERALKRMRPRALVSDLRSVSVQMKRLGKDAQFVGRSLLIGLTAPILGFARKGISAMVGVERQVVRLRKIMGRSAAEGIGAGGILTASEVEGFKQLGVNVDFTSKRLDAITSVLKDVSTEFGISRDVLTAITADFAVLGVTAGDTLAKLTKTAAEVSILGTMDLDASQTLTQTLFLGMQRALDKRGELFNSAAEKQAKATQLLRSQIFLFNAVENATSMSFKDIAESLPEVSAAVTEFGLSFMEGLALVGPIKAAGIKVSVAANAIKMSLQRLTAPTITARKHLDELRGSMSGIIADSPGLGKAFDDMFSVGTSGLQALIDVTEAVQEMPNGAAEAMALYSKLFDKRQSTRTKIAIDDMVAFQKEMRNTNSAAHGLLESFNSQINAHNKVSQSNVKIIDSYESISTAAKLASVALKDDQQTVEIAGKIFTRRDVEMAKRARAELQKEFKARFAEGENMIKDISSEGGKVLFTQLLGAGGAKELAQAELGVALESVAVSVDRIKIAIKEMSITFISDFKPMIDKFADLMGRLRVRFDELDPGVRKAIAAFAAFAAALGPLVFMFGQAKLAAGVLLGSILKLVPGLKTLTVANVAANASFMRLRHGLTMQGATIVNTNTRLATLIATMAGGKGVTAAFASRFGRITGILKKTTTAAADVTAAVDATTPLGAKALAGGARMTARAAAGADPAKLAALDASIAARRAATAKRVAAQAAPLIRAGGVTAAQQASLAASIIPVGGGKFVTRHKGKFAPLTFAQQHQQNVVQSSQKAVQQQRIAALAQRDAGNRALRGAGVVQDRAAGTFARGGKQISQARATDFALRSRPTRALRMVGRGVARVPGAAFVGRGAAKAGQAVASGARAIPGVATAAAAVGRVAAPIARLGSKAASFAPVKLGLKAIGLQGGRASKAIAELVLRHKALGSTAGIFPKIIAGLKAMTFGFFGASKAATLFKVALIKTGIGAIILVAVAAIIFFIKNFDKIKEKAEPIMNSLNGLWRVLKESVAAIITPFVQFFDLLSGGEDGAGDKINAIGAAFEFVARMIDFVAKGIESFVQEKVVPFMTLALGAVLNYIRGIKALVVAFVAMFKGGENATEQLKEAVNKVIESIIQLLLGVLAPAVIDILFFVVKNGIKIFFNLLPALAKLAGTIIKLFAEMGAGLVDIIVQAVQGVLDQFGWLGRKIGDGIGFVAGGLTTFVRGIGNLADAVGRTLEGWTADAMRTAGDWVGNVLDGLSDGIKDKLKGLRPAGVDSSKAFFGGFKPRAKKETEAVSEEIAEILTDEFGTAGADAAAEFAKKFADEIKGLQQKFVDLVLGFFDTSIKDAVSDLVNALELQRDAALEVFEQQLDTIDKLEKAEESLMRQREYMSDRRRMLDERELNRQNFVRNRALAIYEGRIDDARMFDLEERKSRADSARDITDLDDKRNRDLAKENIDFIKDQIKKTKAEADKFFKEQIEAFKEASKEITKFAPGTIEEYEEQLNALTDLAKKAAEDNGVAFAETFEKMTEAIQTQLPNIGSGVFTENLQDLIDIAREKYGLDSPTENSIVGATVAMLKGVSNSIVSDGVIVNSSMSDMLRSMKDDVVDKTLDQINAIFEDKNPHKILAEAIEIANETIRREFERTVGHVASRVDELAGFMDPVIEEIVAAQNALEAMQKAAEDAAAAARDAAAASSDQAATPPAPKTMEELRQQLAGLQGAPAHVALPIQEQFDKLQREQADEARRIDAGLSGRIKEGLEMPGVSTDLRMAGATEEDVRKRVNTIIGVLKEHAGKQSYDNVFATQKFMLNRGSGNPVVNRVVRSIVNAHMNRFTGLYGTDRPENRFQYGGLVPGVKSGGVPALLHGGEFVINSKAVSNIGMAALQSMNNMRFNAPGRYSGTQASTNVTETNNYNIYVDNFIGEDQWFESMMKTYNMKVVPRNQKNAGVQSRSISTYSGINRGM
jgi:hypothetical protein